MYRFIFLVVIAGFVQLPLMSQPVPNRLKNLPDSGKSYSANGDTSKYESLVRQGDAYFKEGNIPGGKKCFLAVIKHYQASGNKEKEAATWLRLAQKMISEVTHYTEVLFNLTQALKLYQSMSGKEVETSEAMYYIGYVYQARGQLKRAEEELLQVLAFYHEHPSIVFSRLPVVYFFLSKVSRYNGDLNKALLYVMKCLKSMEESGDTVRTELGYGALGLIYQELGQTEKSIGWYRKTLEKRITMGQPRYILFRTAGLLAQELIKQQKGQEALSMVFSLSKTNRPANALDQANLDQALGYCYDALNEHKLAEKYFLDAIDGFTRSKSFPEFLTVAEHDIGKFYVQQKQYKKGRPYLNEAINASPGTFTLSIIRDIHLMLFQIDSATGSYLSAINHFRNYKALTDSIFNISKNRQIEELQIQYETQQKDKDIELKQRNIQILTRQSQLQHNELKQANVTRNVTLVGIFLLLFIVILLYNRYQFKQKSNKKLETQKEEIENKNLSLQHLVKEKEWLLKEVHHRVKNNLQIIMSLLNSQSVYLDNDAALQAIRNSQQRIHAISLIHQKLYQPENMDSIDMPVYIRELTEYLRDSFTPGQLIRFRLDIDPIELGVSQAVPLGLILNEAITNAIKYAFPGGRPGIISITLRHYTGSQLSLIISDNGIGISDNFANGQPGSLGFSLMKGLAEEIAGIFTIENYEGTRVKLVFKSMQPVNQRMIINTFITNTKTTPVYE